MNYQQALNLQKWKKANFPNQVVLIERLPDCYRYTTRDGSVMYVDMFWGIECHPIALCGK